jgi:hypothetical protein
MMFRDPVFVAGSGNTYERDAIETFWRSRRDRRDPLTNAHVKNASLFTNWTKRREVDAWLSRHPEQTPEGWPSRSVPPPLEERDARAKRRRNRHDNGNQRDGDDDETDGFRGRNGNRFLNDAAFIKTFCAVVTTTALLSTAFLAATAPAPPPGFPQFPPGVVASTLKGSSSTGMPAPPAWYAAMKTVKPPSGSRVVARRGARGALEIVIPPLGAIALRRRRRARLRRDVVGVHGRVDGGGVPRADTRGGAVLFTFLGGQRALGQSRFGGGDGNNAGGFLPAVGFGNRTKRGGRALSVGRQKERSTGRFGFRGRRSVGRWGTPVGRC